MNENPMSQPTLSLSYTYKTCPVQTFGRARTNVGRATGRDLLTHTQNGKDHRGTLLIKKRPPLGPCSRAMPRPYGGPRGGGVFYERGNPVSDGRVKVACPCHRPQVQNVQQFRGGLVFKAQDFCITQL